MRLSQDPVNGAEPLRWGSSPRKQWLPFQAERSDLSLSLEDTFYRRIEVFRDQWVVNICAKVKKWLIRSPKNGSVGTRDDNRFWSCHHLLFLMLTVCLELSGCWLISSTRRWASQVVQWQRICLPTQETQETWVQSELGRSPGKGNSNTLHG